MFGCLHVVSTSLFLFMRLVACLARPTCLFANLIVRFCLFVCLFVCFNQSHAGNFQTGEIEAKKTRLYFEISILSGFFPECVHSRGLLSSSQVSPLTL